MPAESYTDFKAISAVTQLSWSGEAGKVACRSSCRRSFRYRSLMHFVGTCSPAVFVFRWSCSPAVLVFRWSRSPLCSSPRDPIPVVFVLEHTSGLCSVPISRFRLLHIRCSPAGRIVLHQQKAPTSQNSSASSIDRQLIISWERIQQMKLVNWIPGLSLHLLV